MSSSASLPNDKPSIPRRYALKGTAAAKKVAVAVAVAVAIKVADPIEELTSQVAAISLTDPPASNSAAASTPKENNVDSGFHIVCPTDIIDGALFTKEKRHELQGQVAGGKGSRVPEEYQRSQIVLGTGQLCGTTNVRINWRRNEMEEISQPMKKDNGFDYTENFDGKQLFGDKTILINLKSVVGTGGSQTRTLRDECYPFVNAQLDYLVKTTATLCYFANIFDGDEAASKMRMFHYLLALPEYASVKKYVYVGDLKGYFPWLKLIVC
jgi:hypothetical protein